MSYYHDPLLVTDSNDTYNRMAPGIVKRPFSPQPLSRRMTPISPSPTSPFRRLATPDSLLGCRTPDSPLGRRTLGLPLGYRTPDNHFKTGDYNFQEMPANPDTLEAWVSAAQKSTEEFRTKGSTTPFAWVILFCAISVTGLI
jgi:hypothetical protein